MAHDPHRLHRLRGCHPLFVSRMTALILALKAEGHTAIITSGVRTTAQQQALYALGRTKPGKIVTKCDGIHRRSSHQPGPDGYGYAADIAFHTNEEITWEGPWLRVGQLARIHLLVWGGSWAGFPDRPHLELPSVPTV